MLVPLIMNQLKKHSIRTKFAKLVILKTHLRACHSATNSAACETLNSVSCLVALFDITLIYTKKIGKSYNKSVAISAVLQLLGGCIGSP